MIPVIVVGLIGLGVGLFLGVLYGFGMTLRVLRSIRDHLPLLEPTDGNVAATVLRQWMDDRVEGIHGERQAPPVGYSTEDVDAVWRVIDAGVSARPALGEAISRLEGYE